MPCSCRHKWAGRQEEWHSVTRSPGMHAARTSVTQTTRAPCVSRELSLPIHSFHPLSAARRRAATKKSGTSPPHGLASHAAAPNSNHFSPKSTYQSISSCQARNRRTVVHEIFQVAAILKTSPCLIGWLQLDHDRQHKGGVSFQVKHGVSFITFQMLSASVKSRGN